MNLGVHTFVPPCQGTPFGHGVCSEKRRRQQDLLRQAPLGRDPSRGRGVHLRSRIERHDPLAKAGQAAQARQCRLELLLDPGISRPPGDRVQADRGRDRDRDRVGEGNLKQALAQPLGSSIRGLRLRYGSDRSGGHRLGGAANAVTGIGCRGGSRNGRRSMHVKDGLKLVFGSVVVYVAKPACASGGMMSPCDTSVAGSSSGVSRPRRALHLGVTDRTGG